MFFIYRTIYHWNIFLFCIFHATLIQNHNFFTSTKSKKIKIIYTKVILTIFEFYWFTQPDLISAMISLRVLLKSNDEGCRSNAFFYFREELSLRSTLIKHPLKKANDRGEKIGVKESATSDTEKLRHNRSIENIGGYISR